LCKNGSLIGGIKKARPPFQNIIQLIVAHPSRLVFFFVGLLEVPSQDDIWESCEPRLIQVAAIVHGPPRTPLLISERTSVKKIKRWNGKDEKLMYISYLVLF
jgi:hypothetical protein